MRIIDVDSHFHEPVDWFEKANPALAAKLPQMSATEQFLDIVVGDLFSSVPPAMRPDPLALVPEFVRRSYEDFLEGRRAAGYRGRGGRLLAGGEPARGARGMDGRARHRQAGDPALAGVPPVPARHEECP